jgi:hypothetical protein
VTDQNIITKCQSVKPLPPLSNGHADDFADRCGRKEGRKERRKSCEFFILSSSANAGLNQNLAVAAAAGIAQNN